MNLALETIPRFASKAAFLAWEEEQETRFEFDGAQVTEVTGGTLNHVRIMMNLGALLHGLLRATRFQVLSQIKVETLPGYRYPDLAVGPRSADGRKTILPDPVVVFEVLSPTTMATDLGRKRVEYGALNSIRRYVLLDSRETAAQVLARGAADLGAADRGAADRGASDWAETVLRAADAVIELPEIGVRLPLGACYEDVTF